MRFQEHKPTHTTARRSQLSKAIKDPTAHAKNQFQTSCCQELLAPSKHREVKINRMKHSALEVQSAATAGMQLLPVVVKQGQDSCQHTRMEPQQGSTALLMCALRGLSQHTGFTFPALQLTELQHWSLLPYPQNNC